jgi:hypothetical protein
MNPKKENPMKKQKTPPVQSALDGAEGSRSREAEKRKAQAERKPDFPRVVSVTEAKIYAVSYLDSAGRPQGMPVIVIGGSAVLTLRENQLSTNEPDKTPEFIRDAVREATGEGFKAA